MINKKGQSLSLNTIVIAILVIVVMLVIIVFFTTRVGDTGQQLDENNPSVCSLNNPAIATLGYEDARSKTDLDLENTQNCNEADDGEWSGAIGIPNCCVR